MGRRTGMGSTRGYSITTQFNDEEYEALRACVKATGLSQAETIRRAIKLAAKVGLVDEVSNMVKAGLAAGGAG